MGTTSEGTELGKWLDDYAEAVAEEPISSLDVESGSPYEPPAAYFAESRKIRINKDRPFISKILANSRNQAPAGLFSSSEIITDALLRHLGVSSQTTIELFELRDRVLRVLADDYAPDAFEVLRHLEIANDDETAMEIAVGEGFSVLGFEYEKRGGNDGGPDGVLDARLGRQGSTMADYKIVYDAKTTAQPSVPAEKVDFTALWDFKLQEGADFSFVIAKAFAGQSNPGSALNTRAKQQADNNQPVSVLLAEDLQRIIRIHYRHGLTLTRLRSLFETAQTIPETQAWVDELEEEYEHPDALVPLQTLLDGLEQAKDDPKSRPNINAVRALHPELRAFEIEQLVATLQAVETIVGSRWLNISKTKLDVTLHQTAHQILGELDRRLKSGWSDSEV